MKATSYLFLLVLFISISPCAVHVSAQVAADKSYSDSLTNLLQQAPTLQARIPILKKLTNLYWQQKEEPHYIEELIKMATQADSFNTVYDGMAGLCRYYYNEEMDDSLNYWKNQLDSISLVRSESPNALYAASNLLCKNYLNKKNYELAMDEAFRMLGRAKKEQQVYGMLRANQSLGLIYQTINRDDDAMVAFREGLIWLDKGSVTPSFELQYLSEISLSALRMNLLDETDSLLERYADVFDNLNRDFESRGLIFPVQWHTWQIPSFYASLYTRQGELDKAHFYLDKATAYAEKSDDEEMKYLYYRAQVLYYQKVGEYEVALQALDKALKVSIEPDLLKTKVDLLRAVGRDKEAIVVYDDLLSMNSATRKEAFDRQIHQLRLLNDLNDQENKSRDLNYQREQLKVKQQQLVGVLFLLITLLVLLYILFRYYRRTRRLKNDLLSEKNSLVESEQKLRIAKEEAEEANRKKTAFIANISHEVRTPLNAIVGFSELLADGVYEVDEKKEFASTINNNSELLMNLVNDVLDLSRLESGTVHFSCKPCEIISFCKEAVREVEHRLNPDAWITFTSSLDSYTMETDPFRIHQLLIKILLNAVKFTKKGEINLTVEIEEAMQELCFIVTDTGCGIPVENHNRIFERFEKLDDFVQGTGLGLPICQMIANKLGGSISVDPTYTKGARFIFIHPIKSIL